MDGIEALILIFGIIIYCEFLLLNVAETLQCLLLLSMLLEED